MRRGFTVTTIVTVLLMGFVFGFSVLAGSDSTTESPTVSPPVATATILTAAGPTETPEPGETPTPVNESIPAPISQRAAPTPTPGIETSIPDIAPENTPAPTQEPVTQRLVETPVWISIPAIGVDTSVEWVGLDTEGNMDVPSGYDTTAWFQPGVRPGMTGNAVIAGHLDSQTGPAIFFRLSDLKQGDEIMITTSDGEQLLFSVDRIAAFNANDAPRYEIFGPSSRKRLNLITCSGSFDLNSRQYDERLVVFSTLISD